MKKLVGFVTVMLTGASLWACGQCPVSGGGIKAPLFLLIMALGYWLLRGAEAEVNPMLKKVGRAVSWILLICGFLGALCGLFSCHKPASCPMADKGPMGPAAMAPAAPEPAPAAVEPPQAPVTKRKRSRR
jgi:hypothetical protein